MPYHLINSEKINLVATTTCDFMQRNDSAIILLPLVRQHQYTKGCNMATY